MAERGANKAGRIESRRIYTGKIISLDVDLVRFPDESVGELEMIRHPGASAVVPFLSDPGGDDPQILMIRQYRYAAEDYLLADQDRRQQHQDDVAYCSG